MVSEKKPVGGKCAGAVRCIFETFDLAFGMSKQEVAGLFDYNSECEVADEALAKICADKVELYFDHKDRLWMVKSYYTISGTEDGEALVDRMSRDYRFQTPSSRVAFDLEEDEDGNFLMYIRYTEANMKREYIHHKLAEAEKLRAEEEKRRIEKSVEELEEEEYIPTGPMMF